jgi:hypothetical protein
MALVVNCGLVFWCRIPPLNPVNPPPPPPPAAAAAPPPLLPGFSLKLFLKAPRAAVVPEVANLGLELTPNPAPAAWPIANPAAAAAASWPCGKMDGMGKDEKVLELA